MQTAIIVAPRVGSYGRGEIHLILIRIDKINFQELDGIISSISRLHSAKFCKLCEVGSCQASVQALENYHDQSPVHRQAWPKEFRRSGPFGQQIQGCGTCGASMIA